MGGGWGGGALCAVWVNDRGAGKEMRTRNQLPCQQEAVLQRA